VRSELSVIACAGALVLEGERILLGRRSPSLQFCPDVWDVFGGHVEPGEAPEQTVVRELQEELGITPTRMAPLYVLLGGGDGSPAYECHLYAVMAWTGVPDNLAPEEHTTIDWFSLAEASTLLLAHHTYADLFRSLARQQDPGEPR
jgi:8-oxo-dGTP diphosphatase